MTELHNERAASWGGFLASISDLLFSVCSGCGGGGGGGGGRGVIQSNKSLISCPGHCCVSLRVFELCERGEYRLICWGI